MIRVGLPPTMLPRLRLHWHSVTALYARQTRALREYGTRTTGVTREWWRQLLLNSRNRLNLRARAAARQQAQFRLFEEKYEDLVDLLCWAAKEGVQSDRDARYAELRRWMLAHYRTVRPRLRPYFQETSTAECADPFEALFFPERLSEVIHAENGIEIVMRTRAALEAHHFNGSKQIV